MHGRVIEEKIVVFKVFKGKKVLYEACKFSKVKQLYIKLVQFLKEK